jgi:hypothetical protein
MIPPFAPIIGEPVRQLAAFALIGFAVAADANGSDITLRVFAAGIASSFRGVAPV